MREVDQDSHGGARFDGRAVSHAVRMTYEAGDAVEYIAEPVFDLIIRTGDVGVVTRVDDDWVFAHWPRSGEHSVPLRHVRRAAVLLPEPWWRPDEPAREALLQELLTELSPGHALHRLPVDVQSRCGGCDEVLISVVDGSFALVHLTWSGRQEPPPYPRITMRGPYPDTERGQQLHSQGH